MTREQAIDHLKTIGQYYSQDHSDPYEECEILTKDELDALYLAIKALEQKPRKGHWINKHHSDEDESCSAECSSCHKRSDGYAFEYGYGLKFKYYDFCPKCGSDNREVEE